MSKEKPLIHNKRRNKIRLHHEGKHTLLYTGALALLLVSLSWMSRSTLLWGSYFIILATLVVYGILLNFFRCPIRMFNGPTNKSVVAPADGHVVVIEEVDETEYFHDKRIDICAFRKGRVRFCNSFDATLAPDAAYYILNVWQTLAMKCTDILCLSGNIAGLEQLVKELGRFIKNIKHVH